MGRFDIGMSEGRHEPSIAGAREPRRLDLTGVEARDEQHAVAILKDEWRQRNGNEPPSPMIGISWRY